MQAKKAQEVVSALSLEDILQYDVLKEAILHAYELVSEAYRQTFRNHRKSNGQILLSLHGRRAPSLINGVPPVMSKITSRHFVSLFC